MLLFLWTLSCFEFELCSTDKLNFLMGLQMLHSASSICFAIGIIKTSLPAGVYNALTSMCQTSHDFSLQPHCALESTHRFLFLLLGVCHDASAQVQTISLALKTGNTWYKMQPCNIYQASKILHDVCFYLHVDNKWVFLSFQACV